MNPPAAFLDSDTAALLDDIGDHAAPAQPPLRALLVDDDASQIQVTAISLRKAGFAVSFANDVSQALSLFAELSFDVAVVDLGLGDNWGGIELIGWMRQDRHGPSTRIVAWTSSDDEEVLERALQAGADDVYQKHIGTTVLLAKLQRLAAECTAESATAHRLLRLERVIDSFGKVLAELSEEFKAIRAEREATRRVIAAWEEAQKAGRGFVKAAGWLKRFWLWLAAMAAAAGVALDLWQKVRK